LAVRGTGLALVTSAGLIASKVAPMLAAAFIAPAPVTIALTFAAAFFLKFVPAPLAIPIPALAFNALAPLALARLGGGRAIGWRGGCGRHTLARLGKVPVAPSASVMFALLAFAGLAGPGCRLRGHRLPTLLRTVLVAVPVAIMARPAFVGPAAGPPDFDQFWNRGGLHRSLSDGCIRRGSLAGAGHLRRCWCRHLFLNLLLSLFLCCLRSRRFRGSHLL